MSESTSAGGFRWPSLLDAPHLLDGHSGARRIRTGFATRSTPRRRSHRARHREERPRTRRGALRRSCLFHFHGTAPFLDVHRRASVIRKGGGSPTSGARRARRREPGTPGTRAPSGAEWLRDRPLTGHQLRSAAMAGFSDAVLSAAWSTRASRPGRRRAPQARAPAPPGSVPRSRAEAPRPSRSSGPGAGRSSPP